MVSSFWGFGKGLGGWPTATDLGHSLCKWEKEPQIEQDRAWWPVKCLLISARSTTDQSSLWLNLCMNMEALAENDLWYSKKVFLHKTGPDPK